MDGNNPLGLVMSGIQGKPFHVILLVATMLTLLVTSSFSADIKTLRKQAEAGDAEAQFTLGQRYGNGDGVRKNDAEAVKWYRKAAEQGYAIAQYNLGVMYYKGEGVPQDSAEAVKWYRKAAEQGNAEAQYNLGVTYFSGRGVLQDYVQSYCFFSLAASRSSKYSESRDQVAKQLTPEKLMEAQRMTREWEKSHPRK